MLSLILKTFFIINFMYIVQIEAISVRLCVDRVDAFDKCLTLGAFLNRRNTGVDMECIADKNCVKEVIDGSADVTIINADDHPEALKYLEPILYESYGDNNLIVALIDANTENKIHNLPLSYDNKNDLRLIHAGLYINYHRNDGKCSKIVRPNEGASIQLKRYHEIENSENKKLICIHNGQLITKPVSEYKNCNVESSIPNAVMIKKGSTNKNEITKAFVTAADKVGHSRHFKLFGPFRGKTNLIFNDETKTLKPYHKQVNGISVEKFHQLHCGDVTNHYHAHDEL